MTEKQGRQLQRNCIKVTSLPYKFNLKQVLSMFDRVSRILSYKQVGDEELWIRFRAIDDRKACLFIDGMQVGPRKLKVVLEFSEEELQIMNSVNLDTEVLYFSKDKAQKVRNTHKKLMLRSKMNLEALHYTTELMKYVFSRQYLNFLLVLYCVWVLLSFCLL